MVIYALIIIIIVLIVISVVNGKAMFEKTVNIIMPENYTPKKNNLKIVVLIAAILMIVLFNFVNLNINARMDIEEATVLQLQNIPGIGEDKANLIFNHIKKYGFVNYEEFITIPGIGKETVLKLKKYTRR